MYPLYLNAATLTTALGRGLNAQINALRTEHSGLSACEFDDCALSCWTGSVDHADAETLPADMRHWDCRNHRIAALALREDGFDESVRTAIAKFGANRIGVFMGTSTSGINETELAWRELNVETNQLPDWYDYAHTHRISATGEFVAAMLGITGHRMTISTACSSSAKVFASAARAIDAGLCDAAVVGGVDSLCLTTLYGFNSLQLVSSNPCKPADANRDGISIGEAAGFALVSRERDDAKFAIVGVGESSDAHHMSTPEPQGRGAAAAMQAALDAAELSAEQIDYINLHGTATLSNDQAETNAVASLFGTETPCSSTKGWTGHTLGAAGITETLISTLCLQQGLLPRSLNTEAVDPEIRANILTESVTATPSYVLTNSFGFGGNNCSVIVGAAL